MDVTTAIRTRRSVRRYKKKDIPDNVLREILEAARLAPSAANRQAWELIVVKDPELKARLVPLCKNQKFVEECSVFLVAVEDPQQKWSRVDVTIMMDHITLAAHEKGLGTCWIGAFDREKVGEALGVPGNRLVTVCLTLGYPDESPEARPRKSMDELVYENRYGAH
ncbi:MAG: nitroreductase A [Methanomassiliicoccales archaeon PtaU1.Bin030]|jgi:nitroreductase|nr:MAG: nitroreductase A [Methanomassiliicoccales archaeon PtaU1.Bin030]